MMEILVKLARVSHYWKSLNTEYTFDNARLRKAFAKWRCLDGSPRATQKRLVMHQQFLSQKPLAGSTHVREQPKENER